jgi:hypothetical protein
MHAAKPPPLTVCQQLSRTASGSFEANLFRRVIVSSAAEKIFDEKINSVQRNTSRRSHSYGHKKK